MSDIYDNFRRAWVKRVVEGPTPHLSSELAKARSTMETDPTYDPKKYRAALDAAAAEADAAIGSSQR